jgi:transcriptional regulator with XRE-family HTH domain
MTESTLGAWLRGERERRGVTLKTVADQTKVAAPLLEGLETGDLSRWPGGIYRRAFVKAYASALGLDAEAVMRRFEQEHPDPEAVAAAAAEAPRVPAAPDLQSQSTSAPGVSPFRSIPFSPPRARVIGTAADLTVALVLGLGFAAAGSRLLWPVLLIAIYYAAGVLLRGTSPMVALLSDEQEPAARPRRGEPEAGDASRSAAAPARAVPDRRLPARRSGNRPSRPARATRQRVS